MDTKTAAVSTPSNAIEAPTRRRRRAADQANTARFFLPKPGSNVKNPELGQEFKSEGEVLVEALRKDQCFFVLTIWKAVPEQNGGNPVITKQPITKTE